MGYSIQRVMVAALLVAGLLLAGSPPYTTGLSALAASEPEAAGSTQGESNAQADNETAQAEAAPKDPDQEQDQPPLDLGLGTTAQDKASTRDVLAEGTTATVKQNFNPAANEQTQSGSPSIVVKQNTKMIWTPNSGRFLLKDRQADLSLASSADTVDTGDGNRDSSPVSTKPQNIEPPKETPAPDSSLEVPAQPSDLPSSPESSQAGADQDAFLEFILGADEVQAAESGGSTLDVEGESPTEATIPGETQIAASNLIWDKQQQEDQASDEGQDFGVVGVIRPNAPPVDSTMVPRPAGGGGKLFGDSGKLGESVVGVSPWRGVAVTLLCLGLIIAAFWAAQKFKGKLRVLTGKTLSVIETIGIGAGRQILIVEMQNDALIIGVTPHSINLLDKVPLATLGNGYSQTVEGIISRESSAAAGQWESRPSFEAEVGQAQLPPPIQSGNYSPAGQAPTTIGELRRTRQPKSGRGGIAQVEVTTAPQNAKEELIGRFRSQLNRFE